MGSIIIVMIVVSGRIETTCVQLFDNKSTFYTHSFWWNVDLESIQIETTHDLQLIPTSSVDLMPCDFSKTFVHALSQKCRHIATCCMIQVQRCRCANILYICTPCGQIVPLYLIFTIWHDSPYMVHDLHYFPEWIITVGHRPNSEPNLPRADQFHEWADTVAGLPASVMKGVVKRRAWQ